MTLPCSECPIMVGCKDHCVCAENERLRALVQCLLDEDPNDLAADGGVTVLDVWRKDAVRALKDTTTE